MTEGAAAVRERLRAVSVGLTTPFDADGGIEHAQLRTNARALYDRGARSFLAAANVSEYHALGGSERVAVVESAVEALPADACVLAGAGGSIPDASGLVRGYDDVGADAIMVMPPDHTYVHERGLLAYYRSLADATELPLVPYVRGFEPSVEFLADLTALEAVAGIKYALRDTTTLGAAIERGDPDVVWVNGLAEPMAVATWAEGCAGFTAGVSNFRPEVGRALFEALVAGEWRRARRLRNACLPIQALRDRPGEGSTLPGGLSVPVVKKGLDLAGLHGGSVRPPIRPLTDAEEREVEERYRELEEAFAAVESGEGPD